MFKRRHLSEHLYFMQLKGAVIQAFPWKLNTLSTICHQLFIPLHIVAFLALELRDTYFRRTVLQTFLN